MLKDRITAILFENAFLSGFRSAGDATDTVADQALDAAKSGFKICHATGGNGTMRPIASSLFDKFTRRLMQRLIENECEK